MKGSVVLTILMAVVGLAPVLGDEPDAKEILKKANEATKAVKELSYTAEAVGEGAAKDDLPRVAAQVILRKGDPLEQSPYRAAGTAHLPGMDEPVTFLVISDGKQIITVSEAKKTYARGPLPRAVALRGPASFVLMQEYIDPAPFDVTVKAESIRHEGTRKIGDVECDLIDIVYPKPPGAAANPEQRWYFGCDDHLPRRVERITKEDNETGAIVLTLTDVKVKPNTDEKTFSTQPPEGFEEKKVAAALPPDEGASNDPALLKVGTPAPAWSLKTPDGQTVSLQSLKGKVVVMDFWATWCAPCKQAMPGIQKVHEQFTGQPLAIFGISTFERGDPAKYMRDSKYTYGLLLQGDKLATDYKLVGLPTIYVIGKDGKIAFAHSGYTKGDDEQLAHAVAEALKQPG